MSIVEPLPVGGYGKADWVDYSNYWREGDAEWLMERSVLRYSSVNSRASQWPSPKFGQVTYNEATDKLEVFSKASNSWASLPAYANLVSTQDTAAGVSLSHKSAGGKGIVFQPTQTVLDNPVQIMGGVLTVDAGGVSIKTGTKVVKLTTSATNLVVDSPISATGAALTGAITGTSATFSGTVTAQSITMNGVGSTFSGGVLNGTSGTIGGVALAGNYATATSGYVSQQGYFTGDASSALMRQRNPTTGAVGSSYFQATSADLILNGTNTYNYGYLRIMGGRGMPWHNTAGTHVAWISPTIYSATNPGAANYPDGTIWVS